MSGSEKLGDGSSQPTSFLHDDYRRISLDLLRQRKVSPQVCEEGVEDQGACADRPHQRRGIVEIGVAGPSVEPKMMESGKKASRVE